MSYVDYVLGLSGLVFVCLGSAIVPLIAAYTVDVGRGLLFTDEVIVLAIIQTFNPLFLAGNH